jgi:NitT/TauT family transport system substrate-binding protein
MALLISVVGCQSPGTVGTGSAPGSKNLTKVRFVYDFFPDGNFTVLFATLAQGFFRQEGLDVSLNMVSPNTGVQTLVAKKAQFAFASFTTMTTAIGAHNAPVKAVMGMQQQTADAILSPAKEGITNPRDLVGKSVVDFAASETQIAYPFFLRNTGLSKNEVQLRLVDPGARIPLMIAGHVNSMVGFYSDNAPLVSYQCKCPINVIKWKDYGIHLFGNGIVANTDYIQTHPLVTKAFIRALVKGLQFVRSNPVAGVDDLMRIGGSQVGAPKKVLVAQVKNWLALTTTPNGGGTPIGFMAQKDWQNEVDLLSRASVIPRSTATSKLYTNAYIPKT